MPLRVLETPGIEWDQFAARHSGITFHFSEWGEILKEAFGGRLFYCCLEENGEILCGMPGIILNFRLIRILYSIISYGGVIGDPGYSDELLSLASGEMRRNKIHVVKIQGTPGSSQAPIRGFTTLPGLSHLLDVGERTHSDVEAQFSKNTRRDIRRAERSGVVVRAIRDREGIEQFYGVYRSSMERQGAIGKYPKQLFYGIFDKLVAKGKAEYLMAWHEDRPIAGVCLVFSADYLHYFMGGALSGFLRLQPNELLLSQAISIAIDRKCRYFDFMGSPAGDKNLIKFKEKWGSRPVQVNSYVLPLNGPRFLMWNLAQRMGQTRTGSRIFDLLRRTG